MTFIFEKLKVYRKSVDFSDAVMSITESFPKKYYFLANQLNRASSSISANIAAGNGRFTKADRKNFFIIARGSVHECIPLLELAKRRQLITEDQLGQFRSNLEEISRMLSGLISGTEKRTI